MKLLLILISLLTVCLTQKVISRNEKITEMITEITKDLEMYDQLIEIIEQKIDNNYENCTNEIKNQNCTESEIWKQERSKNSKNITNLQQKIKTHNETIDAILQLNKHEVIKQNLTMAKLFPKISKVKNDLELIENMMFLIEDTYLNLDNTGKSILLLFDHQFNNYKAQQMQQSFLQLMTSKSNQKENITTTQEPANKTSSLPLIDEEIFTGEMDNTQLEVSNLFAPTEEEKQLYADNIPESININEHDLNSEFENEINKQSDNEEKKDEFEDLRIYEVKEEFKETIKQLGKSMHEQLQIVYDELQNELEQLTQSVADLEKAISDLHTKHAKQIVQIYIETQKLQKVIFQLDDSILTLDAMIFDCSKSNDKLEQCEQSKSKEQIVIDDLKIEKSFSLGIIKELKKLLMFEDKNVYDIENQQKDQTEEDIQQDKDNQMAKERIKQIKKEEKIVEEEQLKNSKLTDLSEQEPEHLADAPEIKNQPIQSTPIIQPPNENIEEEDQIIQEVENELKEEREPELEEPEENFQPDLGELPAKEEEGATENKPEKQAKLEFLKKNKRK